MNDNNEGVEVQEVQMDEPVTAISAEEASREESMLWKDPGEVQEIEQDGSQAWFKTDEIDEFKSRWNSIQVEFVDDPSSSVKQADDLVTEVVEQFKQAIHNRRSELVEQWKDHENISTEELRIALQKYRSFLDRLLG